MFQAAKIDALKIIKSRRKLGRKPTPVETKKNGIACNDFSLTPSSAELARWNYLGQQTKAGPYTLLETINLSWLHPSDHQQLPLCVATYVRAWIPSPFHVTARPNCYTKGQPEKAPATIPPATFMVLGHKSSQRGRFLRQLENTRIITVLCMTIVFFVFFCVM